MIKGPQYCAVALLSDIYMLQQMAYKFVSALVRWPLVNVERVVLDVRQHRAFDGVLCRSSILKRYFSTVFTSRSSKDVQMHTNTSYIVMSFSDEVGVCAGVRAVIDLEF